MQSGQPGGGESPIVSLLKLVFWQTAVWAALRKKFSVEVSIFLLPIAVFLIFSVSALIQGLLNNKLLEDTDSFGSALLELYLHTSLWFWGVVLLAGLFIWLLTVVVSTTRKVIRWIARG